MILEGEDLDDDAQFGFSVASAGDFNGDGKDDVIVGAPLFQDLGVAFIYFGGITGTFRAAESARSVASDGGTDRGRNSARGVTARGCDAARGTGADCQCRSH